MKRELDVFLLGEKIGKLTETRIGARFSYEDRVFEEKPQMPLLSTSFPVKRKPFQEGKTRAWFSGLLPEGERLLALCRRTGCDTNDFVGILSEIGWECAGAVSISNPEEHHDVDAGSLANLDSLSEMISNMSTYGTLGEGVTRVSIGGTQEKACVKAMEMTVADGRVVDGMFCVPNGSEISTHILKPQPPGRFGNLAIAEAWAMTAASWVTSCSKVALLENGKCPSTLIVERFDRLEAPEGVERIHQEDCCQALGLDPAGKYADLRAPKGSDPTYARIAALLEAYSPSARKEVERLLVQMSVNLLIGNVDAHAKNYALLYRQEGLPELSPMYDVVPVCEIEPKATKLSMRVNGKIDADEITADDLVLEAISWGMERESAEETVGRTAEALLEGIERADEVYPEAASLFSGPVKERVAKVGGIRPDIHVLDIPIPPAPGKSREYRLDEDADMAKTASHDLAIGKSKMGKRR